jgi:RimJ/RimL family protein N-acetyltransferase
MTGSAAIHDIPEQLESERLLIRAPRSGDGAAVHAAIVESQEELRPWMLWAADDQTTEEVEANVLAARADFRARRDLRLHVYLLEDGSFVGSSGLHRIDWTVPRFEIGYWVRTSQTGRGFATEATRRIARFAFDDLHAERVEIWCAAENQRSASVATRAGFMLEARLVRHRRTASGELDDSLCFVRLR